MRSIHLRIDYRHQHLVAAHHPVRIHQLELLRSILSAVDGPFRLAPTCIGNSAVPPRPALRQHRHPDHIRHRGTIVDSPNVQGASSKVKSGCLNPRHFVTRRNLIKHLGGTGQWNVENNVGPIKARFTSRRQVAVRRLGSIVGRPGTTGSPPGAS